jgi:hypothetical protein
LVVFVLVLLAGIKVATFILCLPPGLQLDSRQTGLTIAFEALVGRYLGGSNKRLDSQYHTPFLSEPCDVEALDGVLGGAAADRDGRGIDTATGAEGSSRDFIMELPEVDSFFLKSWGESWRNGK